MKKKGFTLIELLAVIVILAIIALIATPIVMNTIENAKKGAAERSADNYIDAVETEVAKQRIDGVVLEGEYTIQSDGNLCPVAGCGENDKDKIFIDMSGNKPNGGTIFIENGQVVDKLSTGTSQKTTMKFEDNYTVSYDSETKELVAEKEEVSGIIYTLEYIKGQTEEDIIKYDPVANARCDSGDTCYNWYVLEDGDVTTLTKGDGTFHYDGDNIGTAGKKEVSLILDKNIGDSELSWCTSGTDVTCNGDGVKAYLQSQTSNWTVEVNLPTHDQIYAVNGSKSLVNTEWLMISINEFDSPYTPPFGYWTSSASREISTHVNIVHADTGLSTSYSNTSSNYGVRPVITIPKEQLG